MIHSHDEQPQSRQTMAPSFRLRDAELKATEGRMQLGGRNFRRSRPRRHHHKTPGRLICTPKRQSISTFLFPLAVIAAIAVCTTIAHQQHHEHEPEGHHRLATRSSILSEDEEELTIGNQFHQLLGTGKQQSTGEGDLWPTLKTPTHQQQDPRLTRKRENEVFDPFVSVFDDYLREASGRPAGSSESSPELDNQVAPLPPGPTNTQLIEDEDPTQSNELPYVAARPGAIKRVVIEDDDQEAASMSGAHHSKVHPQFATASNSSRQRADNEPEQQGRKQQKPPEPDASIAIASSSELLNEIKLLFSWRSLPTNKCSRPCGKGQRLNHLSCIDLKYDVRVEEELCLRANLERPSELSDEPCNELDCEPKWAEVEFQQCDPVADSKGDHQSEVCRPRLFKRLECTLVNRLGQTIHLEESRCNDSTSSPTTATSTTKTKTTTSKPNEDSNLMDSEFSIDMNDQIDKERNSILSSEVLSLERPTESKHMRAQASHIRSNEPFYEPGEWSECSGAPCGQLGRRHRQLTCRLFLSRSSKFVDLPESSCASSAVHTQLDREQPCYMDCGPASGELSSVQVQKQDKHDQQTDSSRYNLVSSEKPQKNQLNQVKLIELEDETIYDLEVARYVWRHGAWTKCSMECLGGTSESVVECWDKVADVSVESKHCDAYSRPKPLTRTCNEVACPPEWHTGPFSNCSASCGSAGVRVRDVLCVQRVPLRSEHNQEERTSYQMLVSLENCEEQQRLNSTLTYSNSTTSKPHPIEPCNRQDCKPEWQVGPWSECQGATCLAVGHKNRSVVCVQEFASQEGPVEVKTSQTNETQISPDLREAIELAASTWHPGKAIQVPFSECYREFHTVPQLTEECPPRLCSAVEQAHQHYSNPITRQDVFIDSDPMQDFRMFSSEGQILPSVATRRRTITLKVGGRAQVVEGRNLKIRCRILRKSHLNQHHNHATLVRQKASQGFEWRKDGVRIFAPNTTMADKQLIAQDQELETADNSISSFGGSDELQDDKYSMMVADQPLDANNNEARRRGPQTAKDKRRRVLRVRSWPTSADTSSFQFVAQAGGRFSLVKENTLRIKRLRLDDSGLYTCSHGPGLSESIEIAVVSRRRRNSNTSQQATNNNEQQQNSLL